MQSAHTSCLRLRLPMGHLLTFASVPPRDDGYFPTLTLPKLTPPPPHTHTHTLAYKGLLARYWRTRARETALEGGGRVAIQASRCAVASWCGPGPRSAAHRRRFGLLGHLPQTCCWLERSHCRNAFSSLHRHTSSRATRVQQDAVSESCCVRISA
jgi:hypothetical protein